MYLCTHGDYGIYQWSMTDIDRPTQVPNTDGLGFKGIALKDGIAYLTTHGDHGIWKWKVGTTDKPTQVPNTNGLGFSGIVIKDDTAYLTTHGSYGIWNTYYPASMLNFYQT